MYVSEMWGVGGKKADTLQYRRGTGGYWQEDAKKGVGQELGIALVYKSEMFITPGTAVLTQQQPCFAKPSAVNAGYW